MIGWVAVDSGGEWPLALQLELATGGGLLSSSEIWVE
jgi:hypothetical protein